MKPDCCLRGCDVSGGGGGGLPLIVTAAIDQSATVGRRWAAPYVSIIRQFYVVVTQWSLVLRRCNAVVVGLTSL